MPSSALLKSSLEALPSINEVTVTGNFTSGWLFEFTGPDGLQDKTLISKGTDLGVSAVQEILFDSDDFDSGSFKLEFAGALTQGIAFNQITAGQIELALTQLVTVNSVTVTETTQGAGEKRFEVAFFGVDGLKPRPLIVVPPADNSLADSSSDPINIIPSDIVVGELPDVTLKSAGQPVDISTAVITEGEGVGTDTAISVEEDGCKIIGLGTISGFTKGVDLTNSVDTRIELNFASIATPIDDSGTTSGSYSFHGSLGVSVQSTLEDLEFKDLCRVLPSQPYSTSVVVTLLR